VTGTPPPGGEIIVRVFGRTDVGRTREHNEDCFVVADLTAMNATLQPEVRSHTLGARGSLFMVADGMGGAAAGEIASAMAAEVVLAELEYRWRQAQDTDPETFARAIKAATETANSRIHKYALEHPENRGMGTTATIAGMLGDRLYVAQVGDSRGYLVRNGAAQQITKDQSLMQKLIEAGELTAEEAEVSERRNIILQALGPEPMVKVDLTTQQVRRGDTLVLCSDGMSGQMRAADIARIVNEEADLVATCRKLIDLANENGGPDNITVITARFEGSGLLAPSEGEDPAHQVYKGESESRTTMPVRAASIPEFEAEATGEPAGSLAGAPLSTSTAAPAPLVSPDDITGDMPAAAPLAAAPPGAARPTAPAEPAAADGRKRIPIGVLRTIFGTLAVLLGLYLLLVAIRGS